MPIISRESIENIRQNVDICDVVSTYVQLKRIGARWRGLSPFNQEKTPSFFVLPEKKIFKCFSSGHAGDVFRFLQLKENFNFQEAVEWLSQRYHFPLRYEENGHSARPPENDSKALLDIHQLAETFFKECWNASSVLAGRVKDYWLKERAFSFELAEHYGIGFAPPDDSGELLQRLRKIFTQEAISHSGLFYPSRTESVLWPRFRGRLMIPIRDIHGRTIAFAGRQLEGITPAQDPAYESKYINSPQTPIFRKAEILFGLDQARQHIQKDEVFLLVEGQLDALRCHSVGLLTAVAPQGTGVTDMQLHHLRRYSPSLRCFLDSDEAGQKAAMRVLEMALKEEMEIRFILLPKGQDPDLFLRDKSHASLKDLESLTCSAMAFALQHLLPQGMTSGIHEKERALQTIFKLIVPLSSIIIREAYLQEISQLMAIDYRSVLGDFEHFENQTRLTPIVSIHSSDHLHALPNTTEVNDKIHSITYDLLSLIIHHETLGAPLARIVEKAWLDEKDSHHALLWHLLENFREGTWYGWDHLNESFSPQECEQLYTLLATSDFFDNPLGTANLCLRKLHKDHIQKMMKEIIPSKCHFLAKGEEKILSHEEDIEHLIRKKMDLRHLLQNPPQLSPHDISQ